MFARFPSIHPRLRLALTMAAISTLFLFGLQMPVGAQTTPAESLTVYSGRSAGLIGPILDQFTAETGVQVLVRYGGTAEMAATILEEGDNSPADIFIAQDAGALGALADAGRLIPLPSDVLERVPAAYASRDGLWVGLSGRARVLIYNTGLVSEAELPASILDLTDPRWQGQIAWAPANGSFQANVTAMRLLIGEDATRQWLSDMVANGAIAYDSNDTIVQAVAGGEVAAGLVNHYYLYEFLAQDPDLPIALHYFAPGDPGALINVAGAGVLNSSDQPGLAQRLILYLLGQQAQQYFAETTYEYPLVANIPTARGIRPLDEITGPAIDLSDLSDLQATLDLLHDTGALP